MKKHLPFVALFALLALALAATPASATDYTLDRRAVVSCSTHTDAPYIYFNATDLKWHCTSTALPTYTELNKIAGVTAGTVTASKALVVGASRQLATLGPITGDGDVAITETITGATPVTERLIYSKVILTPSSTITVPNSGSIAGMRGEITLTSGKSAVNLFAYGVQGKAIIPGTLAETGTGVRFTGLLGQVDATGGTLTAGQVSGVWADFQAGTPNAETYPLRVSNSADGQVRALGLFVGHASYALEFSDLGTAQFVENTAGTSAGQCAQSGGVVFTKALKITANGTDYWIGLCTAK